MKNKTVTQWLIIANLCVGICTYFMFLSSTDFPIVIRFIGLFYYSATISLLGWYIGRKSKVNTINVPWHIFFFLCLTGILFAAYIPMSLLEASSMAKVCVLSGIASVGGLYYIYQFITVR